MQNTWHFNCIDHTHGGAHTALQPHMESFYEYISTFMSGFLDPQIEFRSYDLADAEPRVPITTFAPRVFGNAGAANLPEQLAVVLTLEPTPPITRRRRGRLYIGPWNTGAMEQTADGNPHVAPAITDGLAFAADRLRTADSRLQWVVLSRVSNTIAPVLGGFIDNSWDIQRRRKIDASLNVPWGNTLRAQTHALRHAVAGDGSGSPPPAVAGGVDPATV